MRDLAGWLSKRSPGDVGASSARRAAECECLDDLATGHQDRATFYLRGLRRKVRKGRVVLPDPVKRQAAELLQRLENM